MKKRWLFCLTALLALTMLFSMVSCAPSIEDIEDVLDEWEEDEKIYYKKVKSGEMDETVEYCIDELKDEYDIDIDLDGEVTDLYIIEDIKSDELMFIIVLEKKSDAKIADDIDLEDLAKEYDDIKSGLKEHDLIIKRKGNIVFVGSEDLIEDLLKEV